ncbi:MAG: HigA family addiction module antitoxin [Gemmatimonadaceae bacterium]
MIRVPTDRTPQHPGEIPLQDYSPPMAISQTELAKALGIAYARLGDLVHGKRGVTGDTALRLANACSVRTRLPSQPSVTR